ncbi:MAG TPA: hypothetical protein VEF53_14805, partial [Patescibacteria group bacterium]|nr:hypothetical protein [Patescibacteria group bacterium]
LDSTGAMGIARTLIYNGIISQPLYYVDKFGKVLDGKEDNIPSFFREYNWKLKNIYDKFYTDHAGKIAEERRKASVEFYDNIYAEVCMTQQKGLDLLNDELEEEK